MTKGDDTKLVLRLEKERGSGKVSTTTLRTSDRVLARVTDGIYRLPGSAIRELISNAYDADATLVTINTDVPRFDKITIRDNGVGMDPKTLVNTLHHIGGSLKRTIDGIDFGVTDGGDPFRSPGGRRLIGKIGIGLYSVAQLTRHFQIITKRKGDDVRWVADVVLKTYSEDELAQIKDGKKKEFESGDVEIRSVPADDLNAHGTDVVLLDLRQSAKDILKSRERWMKVQLDDDDEIEPIAPPNFHIGRMDPESTYLIEEEASMPWDVDTPEGDRLLNLFRKVQNSQKQKNPKLDEELDNYLKMVWDLALSSPVQYLETHPFDLTPESGARFFSLSNDTRGQAKEVELNRAEAIGRKLGLANSKDESLEFRVVIDGIELKRPIVFTDLPSTQDKINTPLMFVGRFNANFKDRPREVTGGPLKFEAYLFWNSKIVPVEHRGVLIRVHDASGALFDETFMRYQVSEQTRLRQITCEIFVKEGLDAALNIDRESFNFSHPHYQIIQKWLHRALRQFATRHKAIGRELRMVAGKQETEKTKTVLEREVQHQWQVARPKDDGVEPSPITFADNSARDLFERRSSGEMVFDKDSVFDAVGYRRLSSEKQKRFEDKLVALTQILEAYGVLEDMPYEKQQDLLSAIVKIFHAEAEDVA